MVCPLPSFPPLFPPGSWWRLFMKELIREGSEDKAIAFANSESGIKSREWMRVRIAGGSLLSFSVKGGASALKNRPADTWVMARESERETIRYASTLATVYGRTPYFQLLQEELIPSASDGITAKEVCRQCCRNVMNIILPEDIGMFDSIREVIERPGNRIMRISKEFNIKFNPELSIIDAIVRMGPGAIFPLLPAF